LLVVCRPLSVVFFNHRAASSHSQEASGAGMYLQTRIDRQDFPHIKNLRLFREIASSKMLMRIIIAKRKLKKLPENLCILGELNCGIYTCSALALIAGN
jgi:hypothetical protein